MSKIKGKPERISSPFDTTSHKTERTANQKFVEWINQIVKEKNLPIGIAEQETVGADRKQPDVVIFESPKSERVLCLIELKPPYFSPFDEKELKEPARQKATKRKAKYFATSNFQWLIWFNTEKVNRNEPEERQVVDKFHLSGIENLDDTEDLRFKNSILKGVERFLEELSRVHTGIKPEPLLPIDEFLIFRLQEKIYRLAKYYRAIIRDEAHKDAAFSRKLKKWFIEQQWAFTYSDRDFEKAARQTAYLLINKILFYDVLQSRRPRQLDPLAIPDALTKGGLLQKNLQAYFDEVLKIDYEPIYRTDFIDQIAFPDNRAVVEEIKELIKVLKRYDFSKIGFDIIGRIFEGLIPQAERHNLGQYFTNADVVDIISKFCIRHEDDKVLDPSCGTGTFLVRAYQHKKLMNLRKPHQEILKTLWGIDIAKFPAHLSTINLAVNDLSVDDNYPQVLNENFFNLTPIEKMGGDEARKKELKTLSGKKFSIPYPRVVDCIIGNPPYTRQEEITEITGQESYKDSMINKALLEGKRKLADISKRAGIHAYFFVHGTKFLKDGGQFGFIVSNSWMDVDYGKGLQELFLMNYKIVAIIESKVERWFEDADVNTCIIILEKCKDQKERDDNLVRFAYLFKPLRHFIPPAHDMWEKQKERLDAIEKLEKTILSHNDFYQNDELRIYPKKQSELWDEGFDIEENKYTGSKWGKYLRAPEIFFKILEKGKDKLVPLKEIADVRFGIKTGANEFFYLTENEIKEKGIEKEFWMHKDEKGNWVPNKVTKSPQECKSIIVKSDTLKYRVLLIHKDKKQLKGTHILRYLSEGEHDGFHERPTCESRKPWYNLGNQQPPDGLWFKAFNERVLAPLNTYKVFSSDRFYAIYLHNKTYKNKLFFYLNSTLAALIVELFGRVNLGEGALDNMTYEAAAMLVVDVRKHNIEDSGNFKSFFERPISSIFDELGANTSDEVSLDKVKPDRRELDKIVMGDILDLTDDEQLEVYKAVVDLVKSRIEKAKSIDKKGKTKKGFDIELLTRTIKEKLGDKLLGNFYREKILNQKDLKIVKLFHPIKEVEIKKDFLKGGGWLLSSGKDLIECQSEVEAEYLKVWFESGLEEIKVPQDESYISKILPELKALKEKIDLTISDHISSITSQKVQQKILQRLQGELFG
ncbi:MAG: SAM-dependent DNA methyltransferase [Nitrospirae bacterium]|nr:SAM-dependent DNA methyltransferase [Nitrospirota bacterium]